MKEEDHGQKTLSGVTPDIGMPPVEDRFATLTIVWTKDNQILVNYPQEVHIAIKMLARGMDVVAECAKENAEMAKALVAKEPSKFIMPPYVDPRFRRKGS